MPRSFRRRSVGVFAVVTTLVIVSSGASVCAYTPESPEVKRAIDRAATALEKVGDVRLGAKALAARVMVFRDKPDHPLVQTALEAIRLEIQGAHETPVSRIYSLGLSLALLAELDATRYRSEIEALAKMLVDERKANGCWGYPERQTGDTSMTQYAVYGLWNAADAGIAVDRAVWNDAVLWLLRTQDPGGGWAYQAVDPNSFDLVKQGDVRSSMTDAGLTSLFLGGERLGVWQFNRREETGPSPLLKRVADAAPEVANAPAAWPEASRLKAAIEAAEHWDQATKEGIYVAFPCYHLYTIERYRTFREAALGKAESNAWYDTGVDYLLKSQTLDGLWTSPEGSVAATGFAALFLMRATKKNLERRLTIGSGTLIGGRGLPLTPVAAAGQPSATNSTPSKSGTARPGDDLANLEKRLADPQFLASLSKLDTQSPPADAPPLSELQKQLIELARGDDPQAQAAALTALGRTGDLDHVPLLIEAIADARPTIHQAAVDALRYLARRPEEIGKPLPADAATRSVEVKRWTEWLRLIRPVGR